MFIAAVILVVMAIIFILFNFKNRYSYVFSAFLVSIAFLMISAVLYSSKSSSYHFPLKVDYEIYIFMSTLRFRFENIVRLYNFSFMFFMLSNIAFTSLVTRKKSVIFIGAIPILVFFVANDPYISGIIYLFKYNGSMAVWSVLEKAIKVFSVTLLIVIMLMPIIISIFKAVKSKNILRRRNHAVLGTVIAVLNIFVSYVFVFGTFRGILSSNVNFIKIPAVLEYHEGYIIAPLIVLIIIFAIVIITIHYKPHGLFNFVIMRKRDLMKEASELNENISMTFHIYKNAFICLGQQFELIEKYMDVGKYDACEKITFRGKKIVEENLDTMSKTLDMLKNIDIDCKKVDLIECIENVIAEINIPSNVTINKEFEVDKVELIGSKTHLEEVFRNLIRNSLEAIDKKETQEGEIRITVSMEEEYCSVDIHDNGCGISNNDIGHIFDIFYTTKQRGKFGGIGLSYVDKIIKMHHGIITVKSRKDEYTLFCIMFDTSDAVRR